MEELYKLTSRGLDEYLSNEKYVQAEDLITACGVNISASVSGIMTSVYEVRDMHTSPDEKQIRSDLQIILEHIGILAHCMDIELPELEQLEEYYEEEIGIGLKMDVILACMNLMYIHAHVILEHFELAFEEDEPVDLERLSIGIQDMIGTCMAICNRFKYDFVDVVVRG